MKMLIVLMAAMLSVGCASKGSVEALSSRVDALEATDKSQNTEINDLKGNQEALKADVASLSDKMDRAFAKKSAK